VLWQVSSPGAEGSTDEDAGWAAKHSSWAGRLLGAELRMHTTGRPTRPASSTLLLDSSPTCSVSAPSRAMHLSGLAELFLPAGP